MKSSIAFVILLSSGLDIRADGLRLSSNDLHQSMNGNFLTQNIWNFANNLRYQLVDKHKQHLKLARKHLQKLAGTKTFSGVPLPSLKEIFHYKNRKLNEMSARLSRQLKLETELQQLPSLVQQGGLLLSSHLQTLLARPEMLQGVAQKLSHVVMGGRSGENFQPTDDNSKPTVELILAAGFAGREHRVATPDGYILSLHRLHTEHSQQGPVVFLQHGLFSSSADWVIGDRTKAFGFLLADAGFDVWLGNFRGNIYSRNHTYLDPNKETFWQFSWDQMGQYDLPTMLQYVRETTGQQIIYIGHSMGTTAFWVMCNQHPELSRSLVRLMIGLAPVTVPANPKSPIKFLMPVADQIERMLSITGNSEFASNDGFLSDLKSSLCGQVPLNISSQKNESLCSISDNIFFTMSGFDAPQMNFTLLPVILGHTPAGTSAKTVAQFAQGFNSKRFCRFDFGDSLSNQRAYGLSQPPEYNLSLVNLPVLLYWGNNDWLATPVDVENIAAQLPNLIASVRVPYNGWNHLDFMWAKDGDVLLYKPIIQFIQHFLTI